MSELMKNKEEQVEMILSSLLSKCVKVFSSFVAERERIFNESENDKSGSFVSRLKGQKGPVEKDIPPKDALVRFVETSNESVKPEIKKVWHLYNNKLTAIDDLSVETRLEPKHGIYYFQASFKIAIDISNDEAHFSFTMGPLFGRGFKIKIEHINGIPYLGEEKMVWIS